MQVDWVGLDISMYCVLWGFFSGLGDSVYYVSGLRRLGFFSGAHYVVLGASVH